MTHGEATIITELVEKVAALIARDDAREEARTALRKQDDHWRERMEEKTDRLYASLDEAKHRLDELPGVLDQRICDQIEEHEKADEKRIRSWRSTVVVFAVAVVLAVMGTLEFIGREQVAGIVLLILAAAAPFIIARLLKGH